MCVSLADLKTHTNAVHDKIKGNMYDVCGFSTGFRNALQTHIKFVHEKIKDKVCDICDYKTYFPKTLEQHIKAMDFYIFSIHISIFTEYALILSIN